MAGLEKVRDGDTVEYPAATHNAMIDAAIAHQATQSGTSGPPTFNQQTSNNFVLVQNKTENPEETEDPDEFDTNRQRFEILGIDGPVIEPDNNLQEFVNRRVMIGVVPTEKKHWGRFAILTQPIDRDRFGLACVSGIYVARVEIVKETHIFADVKTDEVMHLKSDDSGAAQILWKEEGLGVKWAVLRLGVPFLAQQREWMIVREAEEGLTWVWVERVIPSSDFATNGGLYAPIGPPDPLPEREFLPVAEGAEPEPVMSDEDWAKILQGWEKMTINPHTESLDYEPAVWVGPILTLEPQIFPAERTGRNWHIAPGWRRDVRELPANIPTGSCTVAGGGF